MLKLWMTLEKKVRKFGMQDTHISGDVEWVEVLLMIHAYPNRGSTSRRGRDDVHLVFTIQVAGEV